METPEILPLKQTEPVCHGSDSNTVKIRQKTPRRTHWQRSTLGGVLRRALARWRLRARTPHSDEKELLRGSYKYDPGPSQLPTPDKLVAPKTPIRRPRKSMLDSSLGQHLQDDNLDYSVSSGQHKKGSGVSMNNLLRSPHKGKILFISFLS